ncbi:MAG: hypothetical protein HYV93_20410 [Candidatus Rokubacteria bacterium]|nr:hypothetical protein [Candidatus Rokubacteria bacterium]
MRLALLAAALLHLWDGRTLPVQEWLRRGDEYVVTLGPFHFAVSIHDDAQKDEHAQMGRDVLLLRLR